MKKRIDVCLHILPSSVGTMVPEWLSSMILVTTAWFLLTGSCCDGDCTDVYEKIENYETALGREPGLKGGWPCRWEKCGKNRPCDTDNHFGAQDDHLTCVAKSCLKADPPGSSELDVANFISGHTWDSSDPFVWKRWYTERDVNQCKHDVRDDGKPCSTQTVCGGSKSSCTQDNDFDCVSGVWRKKCVQTTACAQGRTHGSNCVKCDAECPDQQDAMGNWTFVCLRRSWCDVQRTCPRQPSEGAPCTVTDCGKTDVPCTAGLTTRAAQRRWRCMPNKTWCDVQNSATDCN